MRFFPKIPLIIGFLFLSFFALGQRKQKIRLERADVLEGRGKVRVLKGNVVFSQDGSTMYTDSAYFYPRENALDAFGHVRIVQNDGSVITSDKLFYNGNTKLAKFRENVVLKDKNSTVYTDALDYNLGNKTADYENGARILDPPNTLTSQKGHYDAQKDLFDFRINVKVLNLRDSFTLYSEHMLYNTDTKVSTVLGPSTIITKGDTILTDSGQYNTVSGQSIFQNATIQSGTYVMAGDKIDYNKQTDRGIVTGHVRMFSEKEQVTILGNKAIHRGDLGYTKVFGDAVMVKPTSGGDSLYVAGDTLISIDQEKPKVKQLIAYPHAKVYKKDLQSVADSLIYNFADSMIYLYDEPVMWNKENQITADTIKIQLANDKLDKMYLLLNSFIISKDTLGNYNQVKGKNMTGWFRDDTLRKVDVKGNGESIYFVLEGDTALSGMNKVESSDIIIFFKDNKVSTITFINKPEGVFIPPHLLEEPEKRLKGFVWWGNRRPTRAQVLRQKL